MFSSLTDGYAEPDADRVSALRAAADPEVAAAILSATVTRAGPRETIAHAFSSCFCWRWGGISIWTTLLSHRSTPIMSLRQFLRRTLGMLLLLSTNPCAYPPRS